MHAAEWRQVQPMSMKTLYKRGQCLFTSFHFSNDATWPDSAAIIESAAALPALT